MQFQVLKLFSKLNWLLIHHMFCSKFLQIVVIYALFFPEGISNLISEILINVDSLVTTLQFKEEFIFKRQTYNLFLKFMLLIVLSFGTHIIHN